MKTTVSLLVLYFLSLKASAIFGLGDPDYCKKNPNDLLCSTGLNKVVEDTGLTDALSPFGDLLKTDEQKQLEAERIAKEKAEAERIARERAEAEAKRVAEERAKAEAQRIAEERAKAEAERVAKEKAEAEAERIARERAEAEAERVAKEKAEAEAKRVAEEKAKADALRIRAKADRIAKEKAREEPERIAKEVENMKKGRKYLESFGVKKFQTDDKVSLNLFTDDLSKFITGENVIIASTTFIQNYYKFSKYCHLSGQKKGSEDHIKRYESLSLPAYYKSPLAILSIEKNGNKFLLNQKTIMNPENTQKHLREGKKEYSYFPYKNYSDYGGSNHMQKISKKFSSDTIPNLIYESTSEIKKPYYQNQFLVLDMLKPEFPAYKDRVYDKDKVNKLRIGLFRDKRDLHAGITSKAIRNKTLQYRDASCIPIFID